MRSLPAAAAAALLLPVPAAAQAPAMRHATGSFAVAMGAEVAEAAPPEGRATSRLPMTKRFSGGLTGTTSGTMLAVGDPAAGFAAYAAVDQFRGTVDGRAGTFVLLHKASMTGPRDMRMDVTIAPGSGTGALEGITGTLTITVRGRDHFYDLAYALPAR